MQGKWKTFRQKTVEMLFFVSLDKIYVYDKVLLRILIIQKGLEMTLNHGEFNFGQIGSIPSLLNIEMLAIPMLKIPNWPDGLTTGIELGVKSFQVPIIQNPSTNLVKLKTREEKLGFNIHADGGFHFSYHDKDIPPEFCLVTFSSCAFEMLPRLQALFMFYQFRKEIHDALIVNLEIGRLDHKMVVATAKKALAPFAQA